MEKHRFSDAFQIYMTLFQSKKTKVGLGGADGEEEPKTRGKKKKNNGGKEEGYGPKSKPSLRSQFS